jgi:hypothetical protein
MSSLNPLAANGSANNFPGATPPPIPLFNAQRSYDSPSAATPPDNTATQPDRRLVRRERVLKNGRMIFGLGGSSMDCRIINETPNGLLVETGVVVAVPDQLAIRLDDGKIFHVIRRWAMGTRIGLELVGPQVVDEATCLRMHSILTILQSHGLPAALAILRAGRFFDNDRLKQAAENAGSALTKLQIELEQAAPCPRRD